MGLAITIQPIMTLESGVDHYRAGQDKWKGNIRLRAAAAAKHLELRNFVLGLGWPSIYFTHLVHSFHSSLGEYSDVLVLIDVSLIYLRFFVSVCRYDRPCPAWAPLQNASTPVFRFRFFHSLRTVTDCHIPENSSPSSPISMVLDRPASATTGCRTAGRIQLRVLRQCADRAEHVCRTWRAWHRQPNRH